MDELIVEYLRTPGIHGSYILADVGSQVLVGEFHQVRKGSGIGIPVASSVVFQQGDLVRRGR